MWGEIEYNREVTIIDIREVDKVRGHSYYGPIVQATPSNLELVLRAKTWIGLMICRCVEKGNHDYYLSTLNPS